ncbi:hypothetical protein VKT23_010138 [Stygiomarasmius scandens]|uniref:Uncharacterized protein n=1 Tax=Marasmiellus scandens TaxID=2682957 RepID=A0ABR1JD09_9AGAR
MHLPEKSKVAPASQDVEIPPPTYTGSSHVTRFACMSMNRADRLRFMMFNDTDIQAVRNTLSTAWFKGIQEEQNYHGAHEFKLRGYPWSAQGSEAVPSRQMMCAVFETLYNLGWVVVSATDISKRSLDKDTTFFRYQYPAPPPCTWMSVSFNMGDRLRLINAPEEVIQSTKQAVSSMIQKDGWKEQGAYEIKFRGYPWYATGSDTIATRMMVLRLLEVLEENGFTLYLSIDQNIGSGNNDSVSDTDSWYCRRLNSWTKGSPVYHSVPS